MTTSVQAEVGQTTASAEIERIYALQRQHAATVGRTTASERIAKLRRLLDVVMKDRGEIRAAMWADYRKPAAEVDLSEIYPVVSEAKHAIRHLRSWMKPKRVSTRIAFIGTKSTIVHEPKGVVLIVAPWNFPFNLTLGPLISAVAAGNCVMLKPSELTPASTGCLRRILAEVFPESEIAVIEGDASVAQTLLAKRFDHIFFTGSPAVGRIVMKAAAEHLTSVTLELGGKSPVIVDRTANIDDAAKKVAWGKFFNCGQICIAPDYVLVDEAVRDEFLGKLKTSIDSLGDSRGIIVNDRHAARQKRLFDEAVAAGARVVAGGRFDERSIEPTVLADVPLDASVMQEEIFGPILPIVTYAKLDDALDFVTRREKPLALYIFSGDRSVVRKILGRTSAGGTSINQTMLHFYELSLPFGGVGNSGVGKSHGIFGFEAFSNQRSVLDQKFPFNAIELLYPPYTGAFKKFLIDFTVRWL
ncbi:MAG: aldehyde dehydrogenase family protein [Thermoanaerobaculia bacterium]